MWIKKETMPPWYLVFQTKNVIGFGCPQGCCIIYCHLTSFYTLSKAIPCVILYIRVLYSIYINFKRQTIYWENLYKKCYLHVRHKTIIIDPQLFITIIKSNVNIKSPDPEIKFYSCPCPSTPNFLHHWIGGVICRIKYIYKHATYLSMKQQCIVFLEYGIKVYTGYRMLDTTHHVVEGIFL